MTRSSSPTPSTSSEASSSSSSPGDFAFMREPESFRPKTPPPTVVSYTRRQLGGHGPLHGPSQVDVGLVSGHPLWGHILYPAAIALSRFLELHSPSLLRPSSSTGKGKRILELGAGGGLPGLIASLEAGPESRVVISDFPDPALVQNLAQNIRTTVPEGRAEAIGFTWGSSPTPLLEAFSDPDPSPSSSSSSIPGKGDKFDLILLSDLVFNHSQHGALLDSCFSLLADSPPSPVAPPPSSSTHSLASPPIDLSDPDFTTPAVLCFFSHHRPTDQLIKADLGILSMAEEKGWKVTKIWEDPDAGPAFPEDKGDLKIRGTVHGYAFTRPV